MDIVPFMSLTFGHRVQDASLLYVILFYLVHRDLCYFDYWKSSNG